MVAQRGNVASLLGTMGHLAISDIFKFFLVVIVFVVLLVIALYSVLYYVCITIVLCIVL